MPVYHCALVIVEDVSSELLTTALAVSVCGRSLLFFNREGNFLLLSVKVEHVWQIRSDRPLCRLAGHWCMPCVYRSPLLERLRRLSPSQPQEELTQIVLSLAGTAWKRKKPLRMSPRGLSYKNSRYWFRGRHNRKNPCDFHPNPVNQEILRADRKAV